MSPESEIREIPENSATAISASDQAHAARIANLTSDTIVARLLAANIDLVIALILSLVAAKSISDDMFWQGLIFVGTYLLYYFLCEGIWQRTPGKLFTGLMVADLNGGRCTAAQALTRTMFRVIEVNPALLGAIPAALCIMFSKRRQRLGDRAAGTIVVARNRLRLNQT